MTTLESCYELDFSKIQFIERKIKITHPKTFIYGPPKTGKTYLIYDFLSQYNTSDYIYIDMKDYRNDIEEIKVFLYEFIIKNSIKILILENFNFEFDIPKCEQILISSTNKYEIKGFKQLIVQGLDFEEYLLHDSKHQNELSSFNYFFKYGNLPEIISFEDNKKFSRIQEIIKLYAKDSTDEEILKILLSTVDEKKSLNQILETLKKKIKISKDRFYDTCKFYEQIQLIFFVQKYAHKRSSKKLYAYNHSFLSAISHTKKFKNEFTNMVFLHLNRVYHDIFYLDKADFFIEKEKILILSIPFFNPLFSTSLTKRLQTTIEELSIEKCYIITVGNSDIIKTKTINIEVLPFYEWALQ